MKNTKKALWKFSIISILVFSLTNCGDGNQKPEKENTQEENPPVVEAPKNIIDLDQADAIYTNYSKHRIPVIESYETKQRAPSEAFEAARFVDFDYQILKDYIAFVDQEAEKAGVKKVTKLRMYFANYPNENKFPDGKSVVHKRQNSIFMTPTLEKNGGNYSFYIGDDGKPKLIIDWKAKLQKGMGSVNTKQQTQQASLVPNFFTSNSLYSGQSLVLNRGNNGPPPKTEF